MPIFFFFLFHFFKGDISDIELEFGFDVSVSLPKADSVLFVFVIPL